VVSPPPAVRGISCGIRDAAGVPLAMAACQRAVSARFRKPTFNLTAKYDLADDHQVYASFRRGYRSGGFNLSSRFVEQYAPFRPETVDAYELGYKGIVPLGGGKLRLGLAGYYSDYSDIQKTVNFCRGNPCSLTSRTENAATAVIKGVELETGLQIGGFDLSGHYSYTRARYKSYISLAAGGVPVDLSATPFGYVPKHKLGSSIAYAVPVGDAKKITLRADTSWQSSQELEDVAGPGTHQRAYDLTNLRAEWSDEESGVTLALWGTNVFGTHYFVTSNNVYSSIGYTVAYAGEPAMYGIEASVRF
jgi:iron complex outermembrane receptor protein